MKAFDSWVKILALVIMVALLGTAIGLSIKYLTAFEHEIHDRFYKHSRVSLQTFARLTRTALIRGDRESLDAAALLMLDSKALFVQIVVGEREVVRLAQEGFDDSFPTFPFMELEMDSAAIVHSYPDSLDMALGIESEDRQMGVVGYNRIVFDRESEMRIIRYRRSLLIGANAFLLFVEVAVLCFLRRLVRRITTRSDPNAAERSNIVGAGPLMIDKSTKHVWVGDHAIKLTPKQYALLERLASEPNRVFSAEELIQFVWASSAYATSADVRQCVYTLRQRLGEACESPAKLIANVQGYGYKLSIPEQDLTESL
ncbi:winged helix-turn-helix domain-containing protein [Candidatus Bipolaricaulota bacterium]